MKQLPNLMGFTIWHPSMKATCQERSCQNKLWFHYCWSELMIFCSVVICHNVITVKEGGNHFLDFFLDFPLCTHFERFPSSRDDPRFLVPDSLISKGFLPFSVDQKTIGGIWSFLLIRLSDAVLASFATLFTSHYKLETERGGWMIGKK